MAFDKHSPHWSDAREVVEKMIADDVRQLEQPLDHDQTTLLRGRIQALRAFIAQGEHEEAPGAKPPHY